MRRGAHETGRRPPGRDVRAEQVEPHIDGDRVVYLGSVGPGERATILGGSAALLHRAGALPPHDTTGTMTG